MTSPGAAGRGTPARGSSGGRTLDEGGERRSWFGRLLRVFLEPVYFWLDLRGRDRRPSHTKIFGSVSFALGIGLLFRLWAHFFSEAEAVLPSGIRAPHPAGELGFLLAFSFLVFALPYGLRGLNLWAMTRGGGTADVLRKAAEREPDRIRAQAELERSVAAIAERRRQGGGDYEASP